MKWGIISTGKIARAFTEGLKFVDDAEIHSVASRSQNTADRFAREFNIPNAYGSYEELIQSDVEVIYIATPHHLHYPIMMLCIEAGKHILCEKPFTITARQTEHLIYAARKKGVFLMEALWSHFLPIYQTIQTWIANNEIGDIVSLDYSFGFKPPFDPNSRLFDLNLAGGALYDIGIYPIAITTHLLQAKPDLIFANGFLGDTGVDINSAMILKFQKAIATARFGFTSTMTNDATITGTNGRIIIQPRFWESKSATLITEDSTRSEHSQFKGPGLQFEARHVQECIKNGLAESPVMPLSESLLNMMILEKVAQGIGLKYPKSITAL